VGVVADGNVAVISDAIFDSMVGANKGGLYSFAVGAMPKDQNGIRSIVSFTKTFEESDYRFQLKNNVTQQLDMVDELLGTLGQVFLYVGLGFALFASLMLSNFISTSISYKKQEIGILRAIGSRSADVFRIFFAESFIIAMINFVLSVAGTLTATILINSTLRNDVGMLITFLNFGVRQVAILLGVSLLIAFIATFLPVKKIASMKPIDAIKNRK
jgi:ABC-type antimicrobial peptide transport system permease subunit